MKKILSIALVVILAISIVGCSGSNQEKERDLPEGDYSDTGKGTMFITTDGGTSKGGNIPVIYQDEDENTLVLQIELETENFDGSLVSYVYVDGIENTSEQLADSQIAIDLDSSLLTEGKHTVEVVQYEDNDTSGKMLTYKSAQYEVKMK